MKTICSFNHYLYERTKSSACLWLISLTISTFYNLVSLQQTSERQMQYYSTTKIQCFPFSTVIKRTNSLELKFYSLYAMKTLQLFQYSFFHVSAWSHQLNSETAWTCHIWHKECDDRALFSCQCFYCHMESCQFPKKISHCWYSTLVIPRTKLSNIIKILSCQKANICR